MHSRDLRQKFLDFFHKRGHAIIPSASLVPENDPSILFTTAGMHPLVPNLLGERHPLGKRLVNVQKCLRTSDIESIGDESHLTFFEMLGYWSLGDYFKKESIHFTFDFYTQVLGFKKDDITVSVFGGSPKAPFDQESYDTWKNEIGIPEERIYKYGEEENWWGLASGIGPCGPDTEMFIDTGQPSCSPDCGPACSCGKFVEIGNNVFMEYLKNADGTIEKLPQKSVDVGLGLERLAMFSQNKTSVFETDLFSGVMEKIKKLVQTKDEITRPSRIIADHIRAAVFAIADGVFPSNTDRGYVVRRLIRRAIRYGHLLGLRGFTVSLGREFIRIMDSIYPELKEKENSILSHLESEERKFGETINRGLGEFEKIVSGVKSRGGEIICGSEAFLLFQSYGFPLEMTMELARENQLTVDQEGFKREFEKHQNLSRTATVGMFKGGLAETSEMTTKYHTATHLLLAALREVLGPEIYQKGSNITAERLRFDFNWSEKLSGEQIKKIEDLVNQKIGENLDVEMTELPRKEALKRVKVSFDPAKYGEVVKVYNIGGFSIEVCGGPHVKNTKELGHFKIIKEESVGAGIRRIKAILERSPKS